MLNLYKHMQLYAAETVFRVDKIGKHHPLSFLTLSFWLAGGAQMLL